MGLAERKRQLVQDELTEAALKLLAFKGFEETTIDQIAAAAGVSRRTFFRYFRSKEDVVVEFLGHIGHELHEALLARPASETPVTALRQTFAVFTESFNHYPEKAVRLTRLIFDTPALLARYLERQAQWRADLAVVLGQRMGTSGLSPAVTTAVAFAAFDTAVTAWVASDGTADLNELANEAFTLAFPLS